MQFATATIFIEQMVAKKKRCSLIRFMFIHRSWQYIKIAKVAPIVKDGKRDDLCNYRAVSILPSTSKISEKLTANQLFTVLKNYFYEHQS